MSRVNSAWGNLESEVSMYMYIHVPGCWKVVTVTPAIGTYLMEKSLKARHAFYSFHSESPLCILSLSIFNRISAPEHAQLVTGPSDGTLTTEPNPPSLGVHALGKCGSLWVLQGCRSCSQPAFSSRKSHAL